MDAAGPTDSVPALGDVPDAVDGMHHVTLAFRDFLALPATGIVRWLLDGTSATPSAAADPTTAAWLGRLQTFVLPYLWQRFEDRQGPHTRYGRAPVRPFALPFLRYGG